MITRFDAVTGGRAPLADVGAAAPEAVLGTVRGLGFATLLVAVVILLAYLLQYRGGVLAGPYRERWRYLAVGIGAIGVYALSGLVEVATSSAGLLDGARAFRLGATLFVFLFVAVGVRAMYRTATGGGGRLTWIDLPDRAMPILVGLFVVGWWAAYIAASRALLATIETVGLVGAVAYTLLFAAATVHEQEGTSIAAVTRQFTPALVAFAVVVVGEQALRYGVGDLATATAAVLVGRLLAAAFLFATAVAVRQQRGEVSRLYDPTTWRGPEATPSDDAAD